jgi:hypothetical protein
MTIRCHTELPSYRVFAHGTSPEYAENIVASGLNEIAAKAASRGGTANRPGGFHTYEIGPPENPGSGLQMAYEFGHRHSSTPVVLIGCVPALVIDELRGQGQIRVEPTPDGNQYPDVPPQTVFLPATYARLNECVQWQIVHVPID